MDPWLSEDVGTLNNYADRVDTIWGRWVSASTGFMLPAKCYHHPGQSSWGCLLVFLPRLSGAKARESGPMDERLRLAKLSHAGEAHRP